MNKIYLVTSNLGKVESFNTILQRMNFDFQIEMFNEEYPEDKSDETTQGVALAGAKHCAQKYNKPVLTTDVGLFIKALNGFPGVNTKFSFNRIGNEGIIKLLEGEEDRRVDWILSIGYCERNGEPVEFTATTKGTIPEAPRGDKGFGFDSIFIPEGYSATLAEDLEARDRISPFDKAIRKFAEWYKNKRGKV
jgi:XTP/dITP diphosphohydrolase